MSGNKSNEMTPPQWAYQVENFDPKPDDELICSVCHAVFCEPVTCPCNHVFCKECISKWLKSNKNCPVCRRRADNSSLKDVVPIVKNMIMKLTLRCQNHEQGCNERFTLEKCEAHVRECKFEYVKCKNKPCKEKILRKDIEDHETRLCMHRHSKCRKCGSKILWNCPLDMHDCIKSLLLRLRRKNKVIKKKDDIIKELKKEVTSLKESSSQNNSAPSPDSSLSPDQILIDLGRIESDTSSISSSSYNTYSDDEISEDSFIAFFPRMESRRHRSSNLESSQENPDDFRENSREPVANYVRETSRQRNRSSDTQTQSNQDTSHEPSVHNNRRRDRRESRNRHRRESENNADNRNPGNSDSNQNSRSSTERSNIIVEFPFEEQEASSFLDSWEPSRPRPPKRRYPVRFCSSSDDTEQEDHQSLQSSKRFEHVPANENAGPSTSDSVDIQSMHAEAGPSSELSNVSSNDTSNQHSSENSRSSRAERRRIHPKRINVERMPVFERTLALLEQYNFDSDPEWIPHCSASNSESDSGSELEIDCSPNDGSYRFIGTQDLSSDDSSSSSSQSSSSESNTDSDENLSSDS